MNQKIIHEVVEHLTLKGYSPITIRSYERALEQAPDTWNTKEPRKLYEHINSCLQTETESVSLTIRRNLKAAANHLFQMQTGITLRDYAKQNALTGCIYAEILSEFYTYSVEFKHMTEMSAESEKQHVLRFLSFMKCDPEALNKISAQNIRDYVCAEFQSLKTSSMGRYVTSFRNFFRFLEYKGIDVDQSILSLPLAPADWAKSKVPVTLTTDEEIRLRGHYCSVDDTGIRNSIIIRLMLDLGLRCAEVSELRTDDIQWNKGTICIRQTKTMKERELPISMELGRLLEDYILNYRPQGTDPHLFLRRAVGDKYSPMTRECVRGVVRRAFEKENIHGWWKGTHALRRTAASKIYNAGNGLKLAADLLGHESLDSTKAYIRVDFGQLREVAAPWPGGNTHEE